MKYIDELELEWDIENYDYLHQFRLYDIGTQHLVHVAKDKIPYEYPNHLYKFFDNSDNSLASLLNSYLYFPNPNCFNDPFDCLSNREKYIINGSSDKAAALKRRESLGVCCFSLINDNPLMWGHYTNRYKGFCLKFNKTILNKNIQFKTHVSYLKNYIPHNENLQDCIEKLRTKKFNEEFENGIHNILIMQFEYSWKYYDWKYEQEYRAITLDANAFGRKSEFENKCLEEIYIGYKMKIDCPNYYNLLLDILKNHYPHIKIYEVSPDPLLVELKFKPISTT